MSSQPHRGGDERPSKGGRIDIVKQLFGRAPNGGESMILRPTIGCRLLPHDSVLGDLDDSSHIYAAVDVDLLSGDVIALGCEERHRLRNLFRQPETAHRDSRLDLLLDVGWNLG